MMYLDPTSDDALAYATFPSNDFANTFNHGASSNKIARTTVSLRSTNSNTSCLERTSSTSSNRISGTYFTIQFANASPSVASPSNMCMSLFIASAMNPHAAFLALARFPC